jgi:hypothetical protein
MTTHVTKSWMEDGKLVVQVIPQEQIYKREWVELTYQEITEVMGYEKSQFTRKLIQNALAKSKEKNT